MLPRLPHLLPIVSPSREFVPKTGNDASRGGAARLPTLTTGEHEHEARLLLRRQEPTATASMKELLGGKGANLAEMCMIGIPVPPGFTITTEVCAAYYEHGKKLPEAADPADRRPPSRRSRPRSARSSATRPTRCSSRVRSGAALSMPGHDEHDPQPRPDRRLVEGLAKKTGNPRFAYDSYRRLIDMFGSTVMGVEHEHFEHELHALKDEKKVKLDTDLTADDLKELVKRYKAVYKKHVGDDFPQDPTKQL